MQYFFTENVENFQKVQVSVKFVTSKGKKHKILQVINMYNRATKKVVIDAGHGGADPGAVSGNLKEKDLNLQAAQYMYKRLQELGMPATIVRNTDETLDRKERINRILNAYGNSSDVILISNHINAGGADISNYEGLKLKKLFTTTFLIFFSTATRAWFIPANFSFLQF